MAAARAAPAARCAAAGAAAARRPAARAAARAGKRCATVCSVSGFGRSRDDRNSQSASMISMMAGDVIDEKGDLICPPDGRLEDMLVGDLMFRSPSFVGTEDPVFDALEMLVAKGLSGVPVVRSGTMQVVGVVSGYDLLALDYTPGKLDRSSGLFPPLGSCDSFEGKKDLMWQQHFDLQARLAKSTGTRVEDIMHEATLVVQGMKLPDAADIIVRKNLHRVTVVDEAGDLVGVLSRGDVLRATLNNYKFFEGVYAQRETASESDLATAQ